MTDPTWRVSPTKLDAMRRYREGAFGVQMTDDELRDRIIGVQPMSEAMYLGRAIHEALEKKVGADTHWADRQTPIEFTVDDAEVPFGVEKLTSPGGRLEAREAKIVERIGDFEISLRIDLFWPALIVDYKTSDRARGAKLLDQASSWQWRTYSLILGIPHFCYRYYQYAFVEVDSGKRWGKWSKGQKGVMVHAPRDHDLYLPDSVDHEDLLMVARDLVAAAQDLDCAGALAANRYATIANLRESRAWNAKHDRCPDFDLELRAQIDNLVANDYDRQSALRTAASLRATTRGRRDRLPALEAAADGLERLAA